MKPPFYIPIYFSFRHLKALLVSIKRPEIFSICNDKARPFSAVFMAKFEPIFKAACFLKKNTLEKMFCSWRKHRENKKAPVKGGLVIGGVF